MNYIFILSSLLIFIIIYYYKKFLKYDSNKKSLPGPFPLPILGNLHQFGTNDPQIKLSKYSEKYNHIYRMWMGDKLTIIVSDPKLIRLILIENFEKFKDRPYSAKLAFGNNFHGTTTGNGQYWEHNRDIVSRSLRRSSNKIIYEFLNYKVNDFIKMIDQKFNNNNGADNEIILQKPRFYIQRYTISIMYKFIFNENIPFTNDINDEKSKELKFFFKSIKEIFKIFSNATLIDFISVLQPIYFKYLKYTDKKFPAIFGYINEKYKQHLKEMNFNNYDENAEPKDLMESLIYEYGMNNSTEDEIQSILTTVLDFFLAGTETASSGIEWVILKLINNKEYQDKIYMELKPLNKNQIKVQDKVDTPLLNSFIKETLRLHPVAPMGLPRECSENVIIDNKYFIPKGSQILLNFKGLAFNENAFKDGKQFIPERFIKNKKEIDSFLIFGTGKRDCVGNQIAQDEIYCLISNLILNYKFDSIDGQSLSEQEILTLTLNNKKFNIKLTKRD